MVATEARSRGGRWRAAWWFAPAIALGACSNGPDRPPSVQVDVPLAETTPPEDVPAQDLPAPSDTSVSPVDALDASDEASVDTGAPTDRPQPPRDALTSYPSGPYGGAEGQRFEPFILQDCSPGSVGAFDFAGPGFFTARLSVVSLVSGWCSGCRGEATALESQVLQRFRDRGVRVVQVVVEASMGEPPQVSFCQSWASGAGVTFPVLADLDRSLARRYSLMAFPVTFVVDDQGTIRWRGDGATQAAAQVPAVVERLLTGP